MPSLEVWSCGNCGGIIQNDAVDAAGVRFCGFCGAALANPATSQGPVGYEVRLEDAGSSTIPVTKVLAELSSLASARDLVRQAPCVVLRNATQERAEELRQKLLAAGARAVVVRTGGAGPPGVVRAPAVPDPLVLGAMWYAGTEVEARRPTDGSVLASARVDTAELQLRIPTGGAPVPVFLSIRRGDELPTTIHYNHPLTCSRSLGDPLPMPRPLYQAFARILATPLQPGTGILSLHARHDETTPDLAGVTFAVSPADIQLAYIDERGGFTAGLQCTTQYGTAVALNVRPGAVQVTAVRDGVSWAAASAHVVADGVTAIQMWR